LDIRVGVIGVGHLGQHHARIYSELEGVYLEAVVDSDISRAREIAQRYNCKAYSDYEDIIDSLQAVSIVVPTSMHYEIALDCLKRGKDVLLEKPITEKVKEAKRLISESEKRGLILQVGHIERYNPAVIASSKYIEEPLFFEAERVSPFLGRASDVDVTLDLMIHDIDIISGFLGGARPRIKTAFGMSLITDKIDFAEACLEFGGGQSAVLKASRVSDEVRRRLRVYQRDSIIEIDYKDRKSKKIIKSAEIPLSVVDAEPLKEEIKDFIRCVRNRKRPLVSGFEAMEALKTIESIKKKIEDNNDTNGRS